MNYCGGDNLKMSWIGLNNWKYHIRHESMMKLKFSKLQGWICEVRQKINTKNSICTCWLEQDEDWDAMEVWWCGFIQIKDENGWSQTRTPKEGPILFWLIGQTIQKREDKRWWTKAKVPCTFATKNQKVVYGEKLCQCWRNVCNYQGC